MEKTEAQRLRDRRLSDDESGPGRGGLQGKGADDFGTSLGHYRILREIGRGGMGVVYLAEQIGPVARRVAIKIVHPEDSGAASVFFERFDREIKSLAKLEHPNIARVFDAGKADDGRPYFVMEYLEGSRITAYCNQHQLDVDDRLLLFTQVCRGIQHAHQRGIIHRDVKPSNIVVIEDDDRPVPKIIDFGVAKEIDAESSETLQGEILGSPSFMSPEQVELGASEVDTRTDIYSLGVLLYELLVGAPPHPRRGENLYNYLLRTVSEEPLPPSRRLDNMEETVQAVCEDRGSSRTSLSARYRGDLDWIVMKAMAKERDQRYHTASELGEDVARHLRNDPVEAGPESRTYRLRKMVRRHRLGFGFGFLSLLVLGLSFAATTVSLVRSVRAEERATALNQFLESLLSSVDPGRGGREVKLLEVLDERAAFLAVDFKGQPEVLAGVHHVLGSSYRALGAYAKAEHHLGEAFELRRGTLGEQAEATLESRDALAHLMILDGRFLEALEFCLESLELHERAGRSLDDQVVLRTRLQRARALDRLSRWPDAEAEYAAVLAVQEQQLGPDHSDTLATSSGLAFVQRSLGQLEQAEATYRSVLSVRRRVLGEAHPSTLESANLLAGTLLLDNRFDEAEPIYRETLEQRRRLLGDEHPATLVSMNALGSVIYKLGRYEEAEQIHRAVLTAVRRQLGPEHPDVLVALNNLGNALRRQARLEEAEAVYREAIDLQRSVLGEGHVETARTTINLSKVLIKQGRSADAVELLDRAAGARPDIPDFGFWKGVALTEMARYGPAAAVFQQLVDTDPADLQVRSRLALCLLLNGRYEEALPEYRAALALIGSAAELETALVAPLKAALSGRPEPDGLDAVRELLAAGKS